MKIISYDVGIRNMAYCIFVVKENELFIQDWNIINLMENEDAPVHTCCYDIPLSNKKNIDQNTKICGKKAGYEKNEQFFCTIHAKKKIKENGWLLPNSLKIHELKKKTIDDLHHLGKQYQIFQDVDKPKTKKNCLALLTSYIEEHILHAVSNKKKNAGEVQLISLGISMKHCLDKMKDVEDISHVIIENQISPIATRMKTIQGMLAQYYIMKHDTSKTCIEFISSSNKLKHLVRIPDNTQSSTKLPENTYKQHKQDSIFFCKQFLEMNANLQDWTHVLNTSKKDDLADCFLQGLYYLQNRKVITYADNLKINSITLS